MKCFLDLDGVLVDFVQGMCDAHGQEWPYDQPECKNVWAIENIFGLDAVDFWKPANNADFWENLQWHVDGKEILASLEKYFEPENICLLTSPSASPYATAGKIAWIQKNMPAYRRRFLVGAAKQFCAQENAVLVDDYDVNVDTFKQHGGNAILVSRPWNSNYATADLATEMLSVDIHIFDYLRRKNES